jgi:hypothetical protein
VSPVDLRFQPSTSTIGQLSIARQPIVGGARGSTECGNHLISNSLTVLHSSATYWILYDHVTSEWLGHGIGTCTVNGMGIREEQAEPVSI